MKKLMFLALLAATPVCAALPPLAQNIREMQAILQDPIFYRLLGSGEPIQEIRRIETGYEVVTMHYTLRVDVIYHPTGLCGPVDFELAFQNPVMRD